MRTAFGRYCEELRFRRGLSQTSFADVSGMSLSRISNIECRRSNIGDELIATYIRILSCDSNEENELRKLASFSNALRKRSNSISPDPVLEVMLEQFGDKISEKALRKIKEILEQETGEKIEALAFSSNKMARSASKSGTGFRPSLTAKRLAEIATRALDIRRAICDDGHRLDVEKMLQHSLLEDEQFDYMILDRLPETFSGAFACIAGHQDGHTILIEENRYLSAINGALFARHVICHELGHHYLHSPLLASDTPLFLPVQNLARNSMEMIGSPGQIEQVVDTMQEVEAECFATFLMVPWEVFLRGTELRYLAQDYGEQLGELKRYERYFKNRAVLDAFREIVWERGEYTHPVFDSHES